MGYTTYFEGILKFAAPMLVNDMLFLRDEILYQDCRDKPEWGTKDLTFIDLKLTDDYSGLQWNGAEKTYDLVEKVNLVIRLMKMKQSDFGLKGHLQAQGEEPNDTWILRINDEGIAVREEVKKVGAVVECPHCGGKVTL